MFVRTFRLVGIFAMAMLSKLDYKKESQPLTKQQHVVSEVVYLQTLPKIHDRELKVCFSRLIQSWLMKNVKDFLIPYHAWVARILHIAKYTQTWKSWLLPLTVSQWTTSFVLWISFLYLPCIVKISSSHLWHNWPPLPQFYFLFIV